MLHEEVQEALNDVAKILLDRGWMMATAESCTGGWIAKCCTDLAGSSAWFERGFVTYSNEAKMEMLDVEPAVLDSEGAVSRAVAEQMATGARHFSRADVSVAVTGIAGPDGGSADKPVGTVWFAWSIGDAGVESQWGQFEGGRDAVRRQTVIHALRTLGDLLERR